MLGFQVWNTRSLASVTHYLVGHGACHACLHMPNPCMPKNCNNRHGYGCPRDWYLSASWWPPRTPQHSFILRGLRGCRQLDPHLWQDMPCQPVSQIAIFFQYAHCINYFFAWLIFFLLTLSLKLIIDILVNWHIFDFFSHKNNPLSTLLEIPLEHGVDSLNAKWFSAQTFSSRWNNFCADSVKVAIDILV